MAAVNFLYRSKRDKSFLTLRLLFTYNNINSVIGGKTKLELSKVYWNKYHLQKKPKDIEIKNFQLEIISELNKIENHILRAFHSENPNDIDKKWLANILDDYYNPPKESKNLPLTLSAYFSIYLDKRKKELAEQTFKNYKVVKRLLDKYEDIEDKKVKIIEVDSSFKLSFESFCISKGYSINTISRALHTIKAVCKDAMYHGIEVNNQLERLKLKGNKIEKIYLTPEELNTIEELNENKLNESLINARDWLIISCFTGQRISDFMRFQSNQIRIEKGESLIEFTQKKTGKNMTLPLHTKVLNILKKRNGKFPKPISSQKYNDYIKQVCKIAEIKNKIKGSKLVKIDNNGKYPYRKKEGEYEKWELVTSHIGRRSLATNFYGTMPTSYLKYITGHQTEKMLLNYIGKSNKDLAFEITKFFK